MSIGWPSQRSGRRAATLLVFVVIAAPLTFLGYGSDNDSFAVLDAGTRTWAEDEPSTSRNPGYWLFEALVFLLHSAGGHVLTNLATLAVATLVVDRFYMILDSRNIEGRELLTLCFALNPWMLVESTSTMDYVWALLLIVLTAERVRDRPRMSAGLTAGLAIGTRLGSLFSVAGVLVARLLTRASRAERSRTVVVGALAVLLGALFYVPSWVLAGGNFSFLSGNLGEAELWSLKMHVGRAVYKPVYLFGLLTFGTLAVVVARALWTRSWTRDHLDRVVPYAGGAIGTLVLYLRYPIAISYLLPFLFFSYLVLGLSLRRPGRRTLAVLLLTTLSYSLVSFPLAKPDVAKQASDATIGLRMEKGVLLSDIEARLELADCASLDCYRSVRGDVRGGDDSERSDGPGTAP